MNRAGIVLAALVLAGCGGGGGTGAKPVSSPQDLASTAKCTDYSVNTGGQLYTREAGNCMLDGSKVYLATFNDNTARDNYLKIATGFGGVYVKGDKWITRTDTQAVAVKIAAATGGSVQ